MPAIRLRADLRRVLNVFNNFQDCVMLLELVELDF